MARDQQRHHRPERQGRLAEPWALAQRQPAAVSARLKGLAAIVARAEASQQWGQRGALGGGADSWQNQPRLREPLVVATTHAYLELTSIYAEAGLSRQRVSIWVADGQLQIAYRETLLAQYRCAYDRRQRRLHEVSHPTFYQTVFASPQLELIELDDAQWLKVQQRSLLRRTLQKTSSGEQLIFAGFEISALIFLYFQTMGWWEEISSHMGPGFSEQVQPGVTQHSQPAHR